MAQESRSIGENSKETEKNYTSRGISATFLREILTDLEGKILLPDIVLKVVVTRFKLKNEKYLPKGTTISCLESDKPVNTEGKEYIGHVERRKVKYPLNCVRNIPRSEWTVRDVYLNLIRKDETKYKKFFYKLLSSNDYHPFAELRDSNKPLVEEKAKIEEGQLGGEEGEPPIGEGELSPNEDTTPIHEDILSPKDFDCTYISYSPSLTFKDLVTFIENRKLSFVWLDGFCFENYYVNLTRHTAMVEGQYNDIISKFEERIMLLDSIHVRFFNQPIRIMELMSCVDNEKSFKFHILQDHKKRIFETLTIDPDKLIDAIMKYKCVESHSTTDKNDDFKSKKGVQSKSKFKSKADSKTKTKKKSSSKPKKGDESKSKIKVESNSKTKNKVESKKKLDVDFASIYEKSIASEDYFKKNVDSESISEKDVDSKFKLENDADTEFRSEDVVGLESTIEKADIDPNSNSKIEVVSKPQGNVDSSKDQSADSVPKEDLWVRTSKNLKISKGVFAAKDVKEYLSGSKYFSLTLSEKLTDFMQQKILELFCEVAMYNLKDMLEDLDYKFQENDRLVDIDVTDLVVSSNEEDAIEVMATFSLIGRLQECRRNLRQAERYYLRSVSIAYGIYKDEYPRQYASALLEYGSILFKLKLYDKAAGHIDECLKIVGIDPLDKIKALCIRVSINEYNDKYGEEVVKDLKEILALSIKDKGEGMEKCLMQKSYAGYFYLKKREEKMMYSQPVPEKYLEYINEISNSHETLAECKNILYRIQSFSHLALSKAEQDDYDGGVKDQEEALDLCLKHYGKKSIHTADQLIKLAELHCRSREEKSKPEIGIKCYFEGILLQYEYYGEVNHPIVRNLYEMAQVFLVLDRPEDAKSYGKRASLLYKELLKEEKSKESKDMMFTNIRRVWSLNTENDKLFSLSSMSCRKAEAEAETTEQQEAVDTEEVTDENQNSKGEAPPVESDEIKSIDRRASAIKKTLREKEGHDSQLDRGESKTQTIEPDNVNQSTKDKTDDSSKDNGEDKSVEAKPNKFTSTEKQAAFPKESKTPPEPQQKEHSKQNKNKKLSGGNGAFEIVPEDHSGIPENSNHESRNNKPADKRKKKRISVDFISRKDSIDYDFKKLEHHLSKNKVKTNKSVEKKLEKRASRKRGNNKPITTEIPQASNVQELVANVEPVVENVSSVSDQDITIQSQEIQNDSFIQTENTQDNETEEEEVGYFDPNTLDTIFVRNKDPADAIDHKIGKSGGTGKNSTRNISNTKSRQAVPSEGMKDLLPSINDFKDTFQDIVSVTSTLIGKTTKAMRRLSRKHKSRVEVLQNPLIKETIANQAQNQLEGIAGIDNEEEAESEVEENEEEDQEVEDDEEEPDEEVEE